MLFTRNLLRSSAAPMAKTMMARRMATSAPAQVGPIRAFFRDVPVPVDAYPLVAIVGIVCCGGTSMLVKHIYEDRDHLRWAPKHGGVKFQIPQ
ncbi:hypothetical protein IAT38_006546 [Cryptococcus sp. DSM 104549]